MFGKDLVVLMDFDATRSIDALAFSFIPFWIRVMKPPLSMIRRVLGEVIGDEIGTSMAMDLYENDMAVGCFLRNKVKLDI